MNIFKEEVLLRIFIGESDHFKGRALYEHIVYTASIYGEGAAYRGRNRYKGYHGVRSKQ